MLIFCANRQKRLKAIAICFRVWYTEIVRKDFNKEEREELAYRHDKSDADTTSVHIDFHAY